MSSASAQGRNSLSLRGSRGLFTLSRLIVVANVARASGRRHACNQPHQQSSQIEIEAKFFFQPGVEEDRIAKRGIPFVGEKVFTDRYFDILPNKAKAQQNKKQRPTLMYYALTTRDIWLRQRSNRWECKVPLPLVNGTTAAANVPPQQQHKAMAMAAAAVAAASSNATTTTTNEARCTTYHEFDTEDQIRDFLHRNGFITTSPASSRTFEEELVAHGFGMFASITTTRRTYRIPNSVSIDFDTTDFGYNVGEIEMLVTTSSSSDDDSMRRIAAEQEIAAFARECGLRLFVGCDRDNSSSSANVRGKVLEYIWRNDKQHYQALEESGLIASKLKR